MHIEGPRTVFKRTFFCRSDRTVSDSAMFRSCLRVLGRIAVVILLLVPAAGCTAESRREPDFVMGIATEPQNLDPRYGLDAGSLRCFQLMYNGLFRLNERAEPVPDLAESWLREDELRYVVELRHGVMLQSGAELTSADVVFTYRSILDEKNASPLRNTYDEIAEVAADGPYRVRFLLKEPHAPFLTDLTFPVIAAPEHRNGRPDTFPPPGTGPFRFVSRKAGQYIDLESFAGCFLGPPSLKTVRLVVTTDDTTRFLQLKKGEIDFVQNGIIPEAVPLLKKDDRFRVMRERGSSYVYLGFNLRDPVLADRRVREAIAHALNVPEMIAYLVGGYARPAVGVLCPGHWAYEPDVERYVYDPDLARRLLDEAGYTGRPVRFTLNYKTSQNDVGLRKAQYVQARLQELGIKVDIRSYEWSTFFADIRNGNFQLYSLEWVGIADPDIYYHLFHSRSIPPDGANRGGYANPEVDRLLQIGRRTADRAERRTIYGKIQKIVAHDLPYVSLYHPDNIVAMRKEYEGFRPDPSGDVSSLRLVRRTAPAK